jgi:hypothetical protein
LPSAQNRFLKPQRTLLIVIGLSIAIRLIAAALLGSSVSDSPGIYDQVSYHTLALRVVGHHGFSFATGWWPATPANQPTAHWSFLYVLFLSGIYAILGPAPFVARCIQAIATGILQPWFAYRIARTLFGPRVAAVAAVITAGYAYFIYYSVGLLTEAFYIVAILWIVDAALRLGAAADSRTDGPGLGLWSEFGLALSLAVLLRQLMLLLVPMILLWIAWHASHRASPAVRLRAFRGMAVALLILTVSIVPWTVRNYRAFHQLVLLNTNAGFAFYWGNHPIHGTTFQPLLAGDEGAYRRLIPSELLELNEGALDRALLQRGLAFVAADPVRFLRLSLSRSSEYFKFWPTGDSSLASNLSRMLSFGLCFPFTIIGLLRLMSGSPSPSGNSIGTIHTGVWLVLALAAAYSVIHLATWTLVRYRLPVDALMMPFTALGVVWVFDCVRDVIGLRAATPEIVKELS